MRDRELELGAHERALKYMRGLEGKMGDSQCMLEGEVMTCSNEGSS